MFRLELMWFFENVFMDTAKHSAGWVAPSLTSPSEDERILRWPSRSIVAAKPDRKVMTPGTSTA
jgi:hypothetical protein